MAHTLQFLCLFLDHAVTPRSSRYGVVGINCWTGQCFQFATATWGAYPGETLHSIESGIGIVRNYMMFDHPLKSVVTSPFLSAAHIGTSAPPTLEAAAAAVRLMTAQVDGFHASNVDNGFVKGNFLPLQEERWVGGLGAACLLPIATVLRFLLQAVQQLAV